MTKKNWQELKEHLEFEKKLLDAHIAMYIKDASLPPNQSVEKNVDVLIACARAKWSQVDAIERKMAKLEKST